MRKLPGTSTLAVAFALTTLAACGGDEGATPGAMTQQTASEAGTMTLTGAGATFPYPIYSKWFSSYADLEPVRVNYQSIGSGGGIRQLTEGTVDFGASDAPMNAGELERAPGTLHLPTVVGAIAVTYNLPGVEETLKLNGAVLDAIFRGEIGEWDHPSIQSLNPGVALPDRDILVVHRSDGSGTTYVFTDYLSTVSPTWREMVGTGKSVDWPVGLGAKGNEGVTGQVEQTDGSIGYVEQVYAQQNELPMAAIENQSGEFVVPTLAATTAAAEGVASELTEDSSFGVSIVDAPGESAYPIAAWTYLLVPPNMPSCEKARALAELYEWALTDGSDMARETGYAPLPANLRELALERWQSVTCGPDSAPVLPAS
ncbi:MAG TPA: phosphate ABC transporter substrate-binding protein PstS [Longimicrobiaceae bacterium]|nr:phosphate ABC transporter substrate-binding protein PstS [Longimicrobiaceae bacterium]